MHLTVPTTRRASTARRHFAYVLATWFGCGRVPFAPGTAGTLGAIPLYLLLRELGPGVVFAAAALLTALGAWVSSTVIQEEGVSDPQMIVIDEVAGVLITLAVAPPSWWGLALGVVAFRAFDQAKPWPANYAEHKLPGAWGVMFDDVAAGVWGAALLLVLTRLGIV